MTVKHATPEFNAALDAFVAATQAKINADFAHNYSRVTPPVLTVEAGQKNAKIVKTDSQRSVFCFVRIADGAILKAASWKAPAKHARGSIFVNAGQDAVTTFGANYLR